jgi:hypothetical protein
MFSKTHHIIKINYTIDDSLVWLVDLGPTDPLQLMVFSIVDYCSHVIAICKNVLICLCLWHKKIRKQKHPGEQMLDITRKLFLFIEETVFTLLTKKHLNQWMCFPYLSSLLQCSFCSEATLCLIQTPFPHWDTIASKSCLS